MQTIVLDADEAGVVRVPLACADEPSVPVGSMGLTGVDGVAFAPYERVELELARLNAGAALRSPSNCPLIVCVEA